MNFEDLDNPELQARALACETPEDVLALAKEVGHDLSDEELAAISGGKDGWKRVVQDAFMSG